MSSNPPRAFPNLTAVLCLSITSWLVLVPLVNSLKLPFGDRHGDIISTASVQNINPYTDYLKVFTLLLIPPLLAAITLTLNRKFVDRAISGLASLSNNGLFLKAIVPIFLLYWTIYTSFIHAKYWSIPDWGSLVTDTFHEGEFLGLLPNFVHLDEPFLNTFFIHGFGLDALPAILARQLATQDNVIALTRFFYMCESEIAFLACFWILWEIVSSLRTNLDRTQIFPISSIVFCFLESIFFKLYGGRDALFLLQMALVLRCFRLTVNSTQSSNKKILLLSLLIGVSLPLGFLHTYDRAAYFVLVYLCTSVLAIAFGKHFFAFWMGGSALGIALSSGIIVSLLGWNQASEILNQVSYWSKYGKYIAFQPFPSVELNYISFLDWLPILFLSGVLIYLVWDYSGRNLDRSFWTENYLTLILFAASLTYLRILIDRSPGMGIFAALPASFLFASLVLRTYCHYFENTSPSVTWQPAVKFLSSLLLMVAIVAEPGFNIFQGTRDIGSLYRSLWVADSQLIPGGYQAAFQTLQPEVARQSCFYTLTSEGIWYYLFDKPSCSKINYTYYVRPKETQESVVRELQQRNPNIVLLTNAMWSNKIDGIPIADSASIIYQYIIEHYEPYRQIASHWFWKKRETPIQKIDRPGESIGTISLLCRTKENCEPFDSTSKLKLKAKQNASLRGFARLSPSDRPADAVYLSYGDRHQLISVASINPDTSWSLDLPVKALPRDVSSFQVWIYDASQNKLLPIGSSFTFKIKD